MHILTKSELLEFVRERADLFDEAALHNPFSHSAWVMHFIECVAQDDWTFAVPESVVKGHCLMLLYSRPDAAHSRQSLNNYYSSLYSPLVGTVHDTSLAMHDLVSQVAKMRPHCATVNLSPMEDNSIATQSLQEAFSAHGWYVKPYFCFGNWYLPCQGMRFDAYMKERPSATYNTWTRKAKKFAKKAGARLEIVRDTQGLDRALDAYQRVYSRSWKQEEPYPDFVPGWARICAQKGWLRLGVAWLDDTPIAVQFWFVMHRRAFIFKLAYDEEYTEWSAGTVLTAHMFQAALDEDEVTEIDYLTGDDHYKKAWMSHRRERIGLLACNPGTARGLLTAAMEAAKASAAAQLGRKVITRWRRSSAASTAEP
jgi:hypothetical protein